eukprot:s637_g23.t4
MPKACSPGCYSKLQSSPIVMEGPLLLLPCALDVDGQPQPLASAVQVITAACAVPSLFLEAIRLLVQTARARISAMETCLNALNNVLQKLPCPPMEEAVAVTETCRAVHEISEVAVEQPEAVQDPVVIKALYSLWTRGLALGGGQAFTGSLRKGLLSSLGLLERLLAVLCATLPVFGSDVLLRWLTLLLPKVSENLGRCGMMKQPAQSPATSPDASGAGTVGATPELDAVLIKAMPNLCSAICRALAEQESLSNWDSGFMDAAEFLYLAADGLAGFKEALATGLQSVGWLPSWSRKQFFQHLEHRHEWPSRSTWMSTLQQIVQDWQREQQQTHTAFAEGLSTVLRLGGAG